MSRFPETPQILKLMSRKEYIRNIGIIGHIDHGKTTMTDNLLRGTRFLGPKIERWLDYLEEERKRGITIKNANISFKEKGKPYLYNLIDTPGHVDFTGEVTRALRAIDGVVVIVDAVEEIMVQTQTVTCQALSERVKPVLFINKVDRLINELKLGPNEIQTKLDRIVRDFNSLIALYGEPKQLKNWKVDPAKDMVAFGSARDRWGFTVGIAREKGIKFNDIIKAYKKEKVDELAEELSLHKAILTMVVKHLPNPIEAQKYRIPKIWEGDMNSEVGQAMFRCRDDGPTVMCITMTKLDPHAGLVATGRLFSGAVEEGDRVYLMGARKSYRIQQVSMYMGPFREIVDRISAGNISALLGLDLARAGETLVDMAYKDSMEPFRLVKYVSEPVVTIAIEPENPKDWERLVDALRRLTIEDPNLVITINKETGECLLSGTGELHLDTALKFLKDYTSGTLEIMTSTPIVVYREGVAGRGVVAMAKSPNRHNRFWIQVEPLEKKVIEMIEKGDISETMHRKKIGAMLHKEAGWPVAKARNVLAFEEHANLIIDATKGVQFMREVKDTIISGFRRGAKSGPLAREPMRGVKVKLLDAQLHEDPVHRGPAQIIPATLRAFHGSFLTAKPVILEPIYKIEITVSPQWIGDAARTITRKRGRIISTEQRGPSTVIVGYIPVAETFGLATELRSATSGHAILQTQFDHWRIAPENVVLTVVEEIRKRRGLSPEIPKPSKFIDEV